MFKSQNREVLFAYDPADEIVFLSLSQFNMKQLKSVENWARNEGADEKTSTSEFFIFTYFSININIMVNVLYNGLNF